MVIVMKKSSADAPSNQKSSLLLNDQLCFAVYSTGLAMNKLYRKLLKNLGLTYPQYLVMLILWEKDSVRVDEIAQPLLLDSGTMSPLLRRLESNGLIVRTRSDEDNRQVFISLTAKGRELKKLALNIPGTVDLATGCTSPELAALKKELRKVRDRIVETA